MPLRDRVKAAVQKTKALPAKAKSLPAKAKALPAKARAAVAAHKQRHAPSGFEFALADRVGQLRPDHWDALVAGHGVCFSRPYLEALEASGPEGMKGHFALIYSGAKPVAAVACQSLFIDGAALPARTEPTRAKAVRDKGLAKLRQRILICGNQLGWGPQGVAFAADEDPSALWPAVAEALYRIRRADKLFGETDLVMIKDLSLREAEADEALHPFSYRAFETEPNMVLDLRPEWDTFDAYLAAMKSDYRSGIKKQIKDVEAAGITVERLDAAGLRQHAPAIYALYHEVHDRQKMRLMTIHPQWIPTLAERFGTDFRTTILRAPGQGKVLGFITTLKDGEGAIGYYVGFDKEAAATGLPLYLRLLYALVEDAIDLKAAWVSLGRTALEPKAKLGAKSQPLRCLMRHRIPALNQVVKALLQVLPEPAQAPKRTPFKPAKP